MKSSDFDGFIVQLAEGLSLRSFKVVQSEPVGGILGTYWSIYSLTDGQESLIVEKYVGSPGEATFTLAGLASDQYVIRQSGVSGRFTPISGVDYVLTMDVPVNAPMSVPEPISIALIGLGLAGIALIRQRKRNAV